MMAFELKQTHWTLVKVVAIVVGIAIMISYKAEDAVDYSDEKGEVGSGSEVSHRVAESLIGGEETAFYKLDAKRLTAVAVGADDWIYVTGDHKLFIISPQGKLFHTVGLEAAACCMAVARSGEIYVGFEHKIVVYNRAGKVTKRWPEFEEKSHFTSLAVCENAVFVADFGQKAVRRFSKDGKQIWRLGGVNPKTKLPRFLLFSANFDLVVAENETLWVVNSGRHRLVHLDFNGTEISHWEKAGDRQIDAFSGCCNPCHIAVMANGDLVTSEKGIPRLKVYSPTGRMKTVVASPESFDSRVSGLDVAVDSKGRMVVIDTKKGGVRIFELVLDRAVD